MTETAAGDGLVKFADEDYCTGKEQKRIHLFCLYRVLRHRDFNPSVGVVVFGKTVPYRLSSEMDSFFQLNF